MPLSNININPAIETGASNGRSASFDSFDFIDREYPFSAWSATEDAPGLHPVLAALCHQVKTRYWYVGHPHANDLLHAVYLMSLCPSFRRSRRLALTDDDRTRLQPPTPEAQKWD